MALLSFKYFHFPSNNFAFLQRFLLPCMFFSFFYFPSNISAFLQCSFKYFFAFLQIFFTAILQMLLFLLLSLKYFYCFPSNIFLLSFKYFLAFLQIFLLSFKYFCFPSIPFVSFKYFFSVFLLSFKYFSCFPANIFFCFPSKISSFCRPLRGRRATYDEVKEVASEEILDSGSNLGYRRVWSHLKTSGFLVRR